MWKWLAGTSITSSSGSKAATAGGSRRRGASSPSSRTRFPVSPTQLAALTVALNNENARSRLPNLLVVEQTLLCVSGGNDLAAVPDFALARARWELRSLAAFRRSKLLQALDDAVGQQARRNERAQQAAVRGDPGADSSILRGMTKPASTTSSFFGDEADFEDTLPSVIGDAGADSQSPDVDEYARGDHGGAGGRGGSRADAQPLQHRRMS